MTTELSIVEKVSLEIKNELSSPAVARTLITTTFKGLDEVTMKQALFEGMIRGFSFQDFLKRDVYAIPFGKGYSLITSIDNNRKMAMRTGQYCGKTAPIFEMSEDGKSIISCTVTVKKNTGGLVGDFTATVYFDEYTKKRDLWISKPRSMISKCAEMHALRMAFPEELAKQYIEEEITPSRGSETRELVDESKLTMSNLVKNNEESTIKEARIVKEENQDVLTDAESDEINPFKTKGGTN